jgi:hypothetical protein
MTDEIDHPKHYNSHPSGIECITVAEHHNFNIGNVLKYIWRAGMKAPVRPVGPGDVLDVKSWTRATLTDLKKARWYLDREIQRLEKEEAF